jgi:hypothetical protein
LIYPHPQPFPVCGIRMPEKLEFNLSVLLDGSFFPSPTP